MAISSWRGMTRSVITTERGVRSPNINHSVTGYTYLILTYIGNSEHSSVRGGFHGVCAPCTCIHVPCTILSKKKRTLIQYPRPTHMIHPPFSHHQWEVSSPQHFYSVSVHSMYMYTSSRATVVQLLDLEHMRPERVMARIPRDAHFLHFFSDKYLTAVVGTVTTWVSRRV